MPPTKGNVVGLDLVQVFRVNDNGIATGTTDPDDVQEGDTLNPLMIEEARAANIQPPQRIVADLTGGNKWLGAVTFGFNTIPEFDLTLSTLDSSLTALAGDSNIDETTNSEFRRFSNNENLSIPPQIGLIMSTIYQSRDAGTDGVNKWINYIIPRAQMTATAPAMSYQAPGDTTYRVKPTMAIKEPTGLLFSATAMSLAGNKGMMYIIVSDKPLGLSTFVGDNSATTTVLPYKPNSTVVTVNATPNEMILNGTPTALSSVNATTKVATFSAAPGASVYAGILYEMLYPINSSAS